MDRREFLRRPRRGTAPLASPYSAAQPLELLVGQPVGSTGSCRCYRDDERISSPSPTSP